MDRTILRLGMRRCVAAGSEMNQKLRPFVHSNYDPTNRTALGTAQRTAPSTAQGTAQRTISSSCIKARGAHAEHQFYKGLTSTRMSALARTLSGFELML